MRYIAAAIALCLSLAPLEAATSHILRSAKVKPNKNKFKPHKAPKRKPHAHTQTHTL